MTPATLKEKLNAIWNKNEVAYPSHICIWYPISFKRSYSYNSRFAEFELYVRKGRKVILKKLK